MRRLGLAVGWLLGLLAAGLVGFGIAARLSPKPASVVIRRRFDRNGAERLTATAPFVPGHVVSTLDIPYRDGDPDARLDVHRSTTPGGALPTIVWVHGGAWLSGSKDLIANYLRVVAGGGCTVVGVGYSISPRAPPTRRTRSSFSTRSRTSRSTPTSSASTRSASCWRATRRARRSRRRWPAW